MAVFRMEQKSMEMSLEGIPIRVCILKATLHRRGEEVDEGKRDKHGTKRRRARNRQGPQDDAKHITYYDPIHSMNQIIN